MASFCSNVLAASVVLPGVVLLTKRHIRRVRAELATTGKGRKPTRVERFIERRSRSHHERHSRLYQKLRIEQLQAQRVETASALEQQTLEHANYIEALKEEQMQHWSTLRSRVTSGYYQREAQRELIDQAHAPIKPPWEEQ